MDLCQWETTPAESQERDSPLKEAIWGRESGPVLALYDLRMENEVRTGLALQMGVCGWLKQDRSNGDGSEMTGESSCCVMGLVGLCCMGWEVGGMWGGG